MSRWHDMIDWIGGYPFEVAKPEQIFDFYRAKGFVLLKLKTCAGGKGCNEFVFGEAMACGVPCVVTDVGDSAWLVGDTGRVVPPMNPAALADALRDLIKDRNRRRELGLAARSRVQDYFNLPVIVRQYERLYEEIAECADSLGCLTH